MDFETNLQMGKYGAYVWSSVGLTLLVLVANVWLAHAALRAARAAARRAHGVQEQVR